MFDRGVGESPASRVESPASILKCVFPYKAVMSIIDFEAMPASYDNKCVKKIHKS